MTTFPLTTHDCVLWSVAVDNFSVAIVVTVSSSCCLACSVLFSLNRRCRSALDRLSFFAFLVGEFARDTSSRAMSGRMRVHTLMLVLRTVLVVAVLS